MLSKVAPDHGCEFKTDDALGRLPRLVGCRLFHLRNLGQPALPKQDEARWELIHSVSLETEFRGQLSVKTEFEERGESS